MDYLFHGSNRICYLHPSDNDKCIKWTYSGRGTTNSRQEAREYGRLATRLGDDYDGLAREHGTWPGSGGTAVVRELIRDEDTRQVSATLDRALTRAHRDRHRDVWEVALTRFRDWLLRHEVVATDMTPANLCVQRSGDGALRFVLVDGLGHHDRIPLTDHSSLARRYKMAVHIRKRGLTSTDALLALVEARRGVGAAARPAPAPWPDA